MRRRFRAGPQVDLAIATVRGGHIARNEHVKAGSSEDGIAALRPRLERAFEFAARQVRATIVRDPDFFPIYTTNGRWRHGGESWTDWCAGFHAGMMWLIAERTNDPWWREAAEHYSRLLEHRQHDRDVHDLGFIFLNTYLPWYRSTGDDRLRQVLITAGRTLALRFNPKGKYLRSFVAPESLFIDIMMNVPLIFYAARETGDRDLHDLAVAHCRTTERTLVRPTARRPTKGSSTSDTGAFLQAIDASRPAGGFDLVARLGLVALRVSARSLLTRATRPTLRSPSATPTVSSPAARPASFLPGISTFRPGPTASTTARPPPSRHRARGTSPSSPTRRAGTRKTLSRSHADHPRHPSAPTATSLGPTPAGKAS